MAAAPIRKIRVSILYLTFLYVIFGFQYQGTNAQGVKCEPKFDELGNEVGKDPFLSNENNHQSSSTTDCDKFPNEICSPRIDNVWECDCRPTYTRDVANRSFVCMEIVKSYKLSIHLPNLRYTQGFGDKSSPAFMEFQAEIWFKILAYLYKQGNLPILSIDLISAIRWSNHTTVAVMKFMMYENTDKFKLVATITEYFDTLGFPDNKFGGGTRIISTVLNTEPKPCIQSSDRTLSCRDPRERCLPNFKKCTCKSGKILNSQLGVCQDIVGKMNFIVSIPKIPYDSKLVTAGSFVLESQFFDIVRRQYPYVISFTVNSIVPGSQGIITEFTVYMSQNMTGQELRNSLEASIRESEKTNPHLVDSIVFWVEDMTLECSLRDCSTESKCIIENGRKTCVCKAIGEIANSYSGYCKDKLYGYTTIIDFKIPFLSSYMDPYSLDYYTIAKSIEMEVYSLFSLNDTNYHAVKIQSIFPGLVGTYVKLQIYNLHPGLSSSIGRYLTHIMEHAKIENSTLNLISPSTLLKGASIQKITAEEEDEDRNCQLETNAGCNKDKGFICGLTTKGHNRCKCPLGFIKNFVTKTCEAPYTKFYTELLVHIPWSQAYEDSNNDQYQILAQKFETELFDKTREKESTIVSIHLESIMPSAFFDINNEFLSFVGFSLYFDKFYDAAHKQDASPEMKGSLKRIIRLALKETDQRDILFKNSQIMSLEGPFKTCLPLAPNARDVCQINEICPKITEEAICECQIGYERNFYENRCQKISSQYQVLLTLDVPYMKSFVDPKNPDFKTLARIVETEINRNLIEKLAGFYLSCDIDNMVPLGTEHMIISAILSFSVVTPFDMVLRNLELSITESQSLKLLSNSEIILLTGPPVYCYDIHGNKGCENLTNTICSPLQGFSGQQTEKFQSASDFGECKCMPGTYMYPITESCTRYENSLLFTIKVQGKYIPQLENKAHQAFLLYKKSFDITLFDALYADEPKIIGISLLNSAKQGDNSANNDPFDHDENHILPRKSTEQDVNSSGETVTYDLAIYFGNRQLNRTKFIDAFGEFMRTTKFPMFKDGTFISINDVPYRTYMKELEREETKGIMSSFKMPELAAQKKISDPTFQSILVDPQPSTLEDDNVLNSPRFPPNSRTGSDKQHFIKELRQSLRSRPAMDFDDDFGHISNTEEILNSSLIRSMNNSDFQQLLSSILTNEEDGEGIRIGDGSFPASRQGVLRKQGIPENNEDNSAFRDYLVWEKQMLQNLTSTESKGRTVSNNDARPNTNPTTLRDSAPINSGIPVRMLTPKHDEKYGDSNPKKVVTTITPLIRPQLITAKPFDPDYLRGKVALTQPNQHQIQQIVASGETNLQNMEKTVRVKAFSEPRRGSVVAGKIVTKKNSVGKGLTGDPEDPETILEKELLRFIEENSKPGNRLESPQLIVSENGDRSTPPKVFSPVDATNFLNVSNIIKTKESSSGKVSKSSLTAQVNLVTPSSKSRRTSTKPIHRQASKPRHSTTIITGHLSSPASPRMKTQARSFLGKQGPQSQPLTQQRKVYDLALADTRSGKPKITTKIGKGEEKNLTGTRMAANGVRRNKGEAFKDRTTIGNSINSNGNDTTSHDILSLYPWAIEQISGSESQVMGKSKAICRNLALSLAATILIYHHTRLKLSILF